jgi:hypothetical protein
VVINNGNNVNKSAAKKIFWQCIADKCLFNIIFTGILSFWMNKAVIENGGVF